MEKFFIAILVTLAMFACESPADVSMEDESAFKEPSFFEQFATELDYQLNRELYEMEVTVIVMDQWGKPLMGKSFNGTPHTIDGIPAGIYNTIAFTPSVSFMTEKGWFSCKPQMQLETIVVKEAMEAQLTIKLHCDPVG